VCALWRSCGYSKSTSRM